MIKLETPLNEETIRKLKAGDIVSISGTIYTGRDAAHKRIVNGDTIPFDIDGSAIYYVGPSPKKDKNVIGSCGPTTSIRMDAYSEFMLKRRLKSNDWQRT
jgi:fumarate hydratase subunit beta